MPSQRRCLQIIGHQNLQCFKMKSHVYPTAPYRKQWTNKIITIMWVNNIHWATLKKDHSNRWTLDIPPRQITDDLQIRKKKFPLKEMFRLKMRLFFLLWILIGESMFDTNLRCRPFNHDMQLWNGNLSQIPSNLLN